ncbi:YceI family protein [Soonwooa sp.]|uniref:YceI family protein n=1 Tax=Soonwooa sp. TaxID=1938592 RepID=UPI00261141BA|nr:YceI family protein [Soonwooa sp.]
MKSLYILSFAAFGSMMFGQQSFIEINGKTNINTFRCINDISEDAKAINFTKATLPELDIKVNGFDCKHKVMTSDFKKTLSEQQYPNMYVKFLNFSKTANNQYLANVEVKIMNKTQKYQINFSNQNGKLNGKRNVKFSDFQITPPKKMGGMVVVKDELSLQFCLDAKI